MKTHRVTRRHTQASAPEPRTHSPVILLRTVREKPERGGCCSPKGSKTVITGGHVRIKSAATPAPNTQAGLGLTVLLRGLKDHLFPSQQDPEGCWMLFFKGELHRVSPGGGPGGARNTCGPSATRTAQRSFRDRGTNEPPAAEASRPPPSS